MIKIFKRMRREERLLLCCSILLVLGQVWCDLKIPDYMTTITLLLNSPDSTMQDIWAAGAMMMLFAVISALLTLVSGFVSAQLSGHFSMHLREDIFHCVEDFSPAEIDRFSTASLITRSTNDVTQIQNIFSRGLTMIIRLPLTLFVAIGKIRGKHWQWTSVTMGAVMMLLTVMFFVLRYAQPRFKRMQYLTDNVNRVTRENLTGIRVIRAYNAESYQEGRFADANDALTNNSLQAHYSMDVMRPTMRFINNALNIAIYIIGAYLISATVGTDAALTTFSEMVVFSNYAQKILMSFMGLQFIFHMWPRASVSADRINEVLDTVPSVRDGSAEHGIDGMAGEIEFRHVSFCYPTAEGDVLSDISFSAHHGETVAFIGATGSGKTTLVNLIPRFYDATKGEILVDGVDVRDYKLASLRSLIGYAPQRAVLFTGDVTSNVSYGDASDGMSEQEIAARVREAVEIAQAKDFVEERDGDYLSEISRGGTNVSGGQKQRLSIARAIFRKPEIYIFDDTFSALDYKTDRALRACLRERTAEATTLIVAQRIGTIRDADRIIVLDEGRIAGMGTHDELMAGCEIYREIAYTQLSQEELNHG